MKKPLGAVGIFIASVIFLGVPAFAEDLQFQQVIAPPECTLTQVQNNGGTVTSNDCPVQTPQLKTIVANSGRPIVTGKYDVVTTALLRVKLAGTWYTLGEQGSPLTAINDVWQLDLSTLTIPLIPYTYDITVQAITYDGQTLESTGTITIDAPQITQFITDIAQYPWLGVAAQSSPTPLSNSSVDSAIIVPVSMRLIVPDNGVGVPLHPYVLPTAILIVVPTVALVGIGIITSRGGRFKK